MARIRSCKPEYWSDPTMGSISRDARLLYIGLWNFADEHGRMHGDPRLVKGWIFPYDDDLEAASVGELLRELELSGRVVLYRRGLNQYIHLPMLGKHQRLEAEKVPSRLPAPEDVPEPDRTPSDLLRQSAQTSPRDAQTHPDESSLLYVAGSREHVAGSRESPPARAKSTDLVVAATPPRAEIEELCAHLADRIERNGSKRPTITKAWREEARRLIDLDGRTRDQVNAAIDWCQADSFWRSKILSMPKLREKYDQLRLDAERARTGTVRTSTTDDRVTMVRGAVDQVKAYRAQQARTGELIGEIER